MSEQPKKTTAFIRWKDTNVGMDVFCECGYASHIDGTYAYYFRCIRCARVYELSSDIEMKPVPAGVAEETISEGINLKIDDERIYIETVKGDDGTETTSVRLLDVAPPDDDVALGAPSSYLA